MLNITLKGNDVREVAENTTVDQLCREISMGLYRFACAARVDGNVVDLRFRLKSDCNVEILTFDSEEGREAFWHTASHIMAQAVKRLYPDTKLAIGPAIQDGFYYDFDTSRPFNADDLSAIEAQMKKIAKETLLIERFELPRDQAIESMESEPYKQELISDLPEDAPLSFYKQGEFVDLCAGPHLPDTGRVKAVKLLGVTGAYWRGDSTKKMLQRIYGVAFPKASMLEEHLAMLEEAKKRDHNKLGRELEYFTTVDYIGQGLPILMPKGAKVLQILQRFVEDEEEKRGYLLTKTPFLAKSDLYKISGHWDHYRESMFVLGDEEKGEEAFALRPMTCPFQFQVYLSRLRSYKELPIRLNETSTLFRNEASGEMHGLIRVRQFTISEGHIACHPDQLDDEFRGCVDLANFMIKTLGFEQDVTYRFSKWDKDNTDKYIGTAKQWEDAQNRMREILNGLNLSYTEADGEAAFYGPKLDIQMRNVHGKEDTIITIQLDFQLAERFNMEYVDADGQKKLPYVIHRTSIGCYERTLALLIEKYAGALPAWIAPEQARVLPISERQSEAARGILTELRAAGLRAEIDLRNEKIGYRIREAQMQKVPYMLVVGDKEVNDGTVSVRSRKEGDSEVMPLFRFIEKLCREVEDKVN